MSDNESNNLPSTRRALLGGLTLGAAAVVAETVSSSPAQATQDQPVLAGQWNTATDHTWIQNVGNSDTTTGEALEVFGADFGGSGLTAYSEGGGDPAIYAEGNGDGVKAYGRGNGVSGRTSNPVASGVYGENVGGGYGVAGRSNDPKGTGVFGEALGTGGVGLLGHSGSGGNALKVVGKAQFSRSGRKPIASGTDKLVVNLAGVTSSSIVIATLQKHVSGYSLAAAVPGSGFFTLWLNKDAPSGGILVAWFIIN